jgi:hypothetical protein
MKGFVAKALAGVVLSGGALSSGCYTYQKIVDPCWPQRYNYAAEREVISAFAPQVQNGHVLDQTLYNYQFETGTDRLTEGGKDQLDTLVRRRPCPDPRIFLATARDVPYDPANPDAMVEARRDLDNRRAAAVQKYLSAQTAGRPTAFEIVVHDPMPVGEQGDPVNRSIRLNNNSTSGNLSGGATATTASSTGASAGGGGPPTAGSGAPPQGGQGGQGQPSGGAQR